MFSLISGTIQVLTASPTYYILILGLDNAGKTSLFNAFKGKPSNTVPTVGLNTAVIKTRGLKLVLWDVGGQTSLQGLWGDFVPQAHAIIFMIDSTDPDRFKETIRVLSELLPSIQDTPLLVLANKVDVENCTPITLLQREFNPIASKLEASDTKVLPVSALKGTGVEEALEWICYRVKRNNHIKAPLYQN